VTHESAMLLILAMIIDQNLANHIDAVARSTNP
jgi:hypothetical protein